MEYEIHTKCRECDGYGILEHQIAVDESKDSDCPECDGSRFVVHTEVYDSAEDAYADYPESFINPSKWTGAKSRKRAAMIASDLGLLR